MRWIGDGKIIIFLGKRKTGKSVLVLDYLWHNQDLPIGTVISPTDDLNETYSPHVPAIFIHTKFTPKLISDFLTRQRQMVARCLRDPNYKDADPRAFLILDDCLYNANSWTKNEDILWIFMNGRHARITLLLTAQYVMGIPPNLRTNVDYIFICKEPKVNNREKLYKNYAGMFPKFQLFEKVMLSCTQDYGCLVIDNGSISSKVQDQVYWYKATIHEEGFRLCYDQFWTNNEAYRTAGTDQYYDKENCNGGDKGRDEPHMDDFERYSTSRNDIKFEINRI